MNDKIPRSPSVEMCPGPNGIIAAYERSLESPTIDVICLSEGYTSVIGSYFDETYSPKLDGSDIVVREIIRKSEENEGYQREGSDNRKIKLMPKGKYTESDLLVCEDIVILISYDQQNPYALIISDHTQVDSFKHRFELIWDNI